MGNVAVINISGLTSYAYESVFGGSSALERMIAWAKEIPQYQGIIVLADMDDKYSLPSCGDFIEIIRRERWTELTLVGALEEAVTRLQGQEVEAFFYARGDCPLMDVHTTQVLWDLHYKYNAEYTFADGYPYGLTPEVLSLQLPEKLKTLCKDILVEKNDLFEILRRDINAFDVETHLAPKDLRMQRVSISCDTKRNKNIAELLYVAGGKDANTMCQVIPQNLSLLRNLPAYFPIQITDYCPQACSYCPFPLFSGNPLDGKTFMELAQFETLCRKIVNFSGDAVIAPSLWGEPAAHPEIEAIIRTALNVLGGQHTRVLIETSGIGWSKKILENLAKEFSDGQLMWIVSLDTADKDLYKQLRGEGMEEAENTARTLANLFGKNCWIQAVRMNENEEHLMNFYQKWKDVGGGAIIQKHDSYSQYLENRQPADLAPLDRFPCWHLKRDMPILIDGTVPLCRTDLGRRKALGNAFEEDMDIIWSRGATFHDAHVRSEYPGTCAQCDEYYTFNF